MHNIGAVSLPVVLFSSAIVLFSITDDCYSARNKNKIKNNTYVITGDEGFMFRHTVLEGQNVRAKCLVPPDVLETAINLTTTWMFNQSDIIFPTKNNHIKVHKSWLHIRNVTKADNGLYSCAIFYDLPNGNDNGFYKDFWLKVVKQLVTFGEEKNKSPPQSLSLKREVDDDESLLLSEALPYLSDLKEQDIFASIGENMSLPCYLPPNSDIDYVTWLKDGQLLKNMTEGFIDLNLSVLSDNDAGRYSCRLNSEENNRITFALHVYSTNDEV